MAAAARTTALVGGALPPAWNGVGRYGYVNKDLRQVLGRHVGSPYELSFCGRGRRTDCRRTLRASLAGAVRQAGTDQGVGSARALTYDKYEDHIRSITAGVVGVRSIDWQNRPTFQQVVSYTGHRRR